MSRNPYRAAERVFVKIGNAVRIAICAFSIGAFLLMLVVACLQAGWGWWTLLLIPGIPAALVLIGGVVALYWIIVGFVEEKWRDAKYGWEREHASASKETPNG